ncbi:PucR family transcriptional regulator [Bacillus sp. KH172YL63]|uniref:PucR family transcriptional regulator n=1 Tax=Bacillus sp. KH172YL63 TaxID=2709784 RepID=UPI0013E47B00|nr:helix-turn-helix domain-containing protein [Bacillus sp. KH172YL63]BCB02902.1 hypothetical protein KH172YL63_10350 [Bacillus sp. KH172YL63]
MLTSLRKKYPTAILQNHFPSLLDDTIVWFTDSSEEQYIGLSRNDTPIGELEVLSCLLQEVKMPPLTVNDSREASEWHAYLFEQGSRPNGATGDHRIIQFSMKDVAEQGMLKEAFKHLLPHGTCLVFQHDGAGLIIEEKNEFSLDEEQLLSISHVIEADFFVSLSFFIGQFRPVDADFPSSFSFEQELFSFSQTVHKKASIQTAVKILPAFTLHHLPHEWRLNLFGKVTDLFQEDPEMIHTVKAFLENQSNISQTAKQLFMHRNSVQYRIDKFIEKTDIDIKTFQGGVLAYFACLDFQSDNLPKKM